MILRVLVVAGLLALLVTWERSLAEGADAERARRTDDIGFLIPQEEREAMVVAGIGVEFGDGRRLRYARMQGMWRCLEAFGAPADARTVESLISKLREAEGRVQSDDPARFANYGIGTRDTVRVALLDPGLEELWSCELGLASADGDGAFVRPVGLAQVWAVDANPRAELSSQTRPHLPPMLDPTLVTRAWPQTARGIARIFVDHRDSGYELRREEVEVTPEEMQQGKAPYRWVVVQDGVPRPGSDGHTFAYLAYLMSAAGYEQILNPETAGGLGLDDPEVRVTLFGDEGEPLELRLGPPIPGRGVPVYNSASGSILETARETVDLVAPSPDALLDPTGPNPWQELLDVHR